MTSSPPALLAGRDRTPYDIGSASVDDTVSIVTRGWRRLWRPSAITLHGQRLTVADPAIDPATRNALYRGLYERDKVHQIKTKVEPNDVVLDVGCGSGLTSLVAASMVGPENVVAIDADHRAVGVARANFAANELAVELVHAAAVPRADLTDDGCVDFYVNEAFGRSSDFPRAGGLAAAEVPALDLGEVLTERGVSALNLDVQGSEFALLTALGAELATVRLILLTIHEQVMGYDASVRLLRHLFDLGFALDFPHSRGQATILVRRRFA